MEYKTICHWDEELWGKASIVYHQAFGVHAAKPDKIIRNMFRKGLCYLHIAFDQNEMIAMALTGKIRGGKTLLIDYLAISEKKRNQGIGLEFMEELKVWANKEHVDSLLIEVEYQIASEKALVHFWERCGFVLSEYIHQYTWVPQPYQAMYLKLRKDSKLPTTGKELFIYIEQFHKESYKTP